MKLEDQIYRLEETAKKLLKENAELRKKAKLYEILIEDTASHLKTMKEDEGAIITYNQAEDFLNITIEENFDKLVEMVMEVYNEI